MTQHIRIEEWNLGKNSAQILSLQDMMKIMDYSPFEIIATSGGFDPIHPGHQSVFTDVKRLIHRKDKFSSFPHLLVLVNSDEFLRFKKGTELLDIKTRCQIVSFCKDVDFVVPFFPTNPNDMTVCEALEKIKPDYFAKGGDRTGIENIPEWKVCQKNNIKILTNLGVDKEWSSSNILDSYYYRRNKFNEV